jgi:hypothetical protein
LPDAPSNPAKRCNHNGNLPPGIHAATWDELVARFGHTAPRQRLLAGLRVVLDVLVACGCRRAWLDGSFVIDCETVLQRAPADFDRCWDVAGVDVARLALLAPALDPLRPDLTAQRRLFGGECCFVAEPLGRTDPGLLAFFQQDRDGRTKGLVLMTLTDERGAAR